MVQVMIIILLLVNLEEIIETVWGKYITQNLFH